MRTQTMITDITHDDLVDLLSTATYGSNWLECFAPDKEGLDIQATDCLEDVWAKALLAGKKIGCVDHFAEGEIYGDLGHIDEDDDAVYLISLEDVRNGLERAFDGTFAEAGDLAEWIRECVVHFIAGEGELDQPEAEALMQIIMFNEIVY